MIQKILKILFAKKIFYLPKKSNILIIDDNFKLIFDEKIKKKEI